MSATLRQAFNPRDFIYNVFEEFNETIPKLEQLFRGHIWFVCPSSRCEYGDHGRLEPPVKKFQERCRGKDVCRSLARARRYRRYPKGLTVDSPVEEFVYGPEVEPRLNQGREAGCRKGVIVSANFRTFRERCEMLAIVDEIGNEGNLQCRNCRAGFWKVVHDLYNPLYQRRTVTSQD